MKRTHHIYLILAIGLIFVFSGCSDNRKTLLFFGDSLTAAEGMDSKYTFPALVSRQFDEYRAINLGKTEWSTTTFLQNWDVVEKSFPAKADVVFIQLGAYDLIEYGHQKATITTCIKNMEMILIKLRSRFPKAEIVLMSSTKVDVATMDEQLKETGFGSETNPYLSRIAEGYAMIAEENYFNFIDLHRQVPLRTTSDGLLLNPNGHNIVANVITRFLRHLMESKQESSSSNG